MKQFFDEFGFDNFDVSILEEVSEEEVYNKEMHYIELYNSYVPNGYNRSKGGKSTLGYKHDEKAKLKMSKNRNRAFGKENHFYGKKHTDETKEKMRKAWKEKRSVTPQMLENMKKGNEKQKRKVRNVETGEVFGSVQQTADKYEVSATNISRVCRIKTRTVRGYHFEYVD